VVPTQKSLPRNLAKLSTRPQALHLRAQPSVFDDSFRYFLGTHRIQRVSSTEKKGRRHTSIVEVVESVVTNKTIVPRETDIRVDTFRGTGAGGQHRNKTDSCVRMTHLPTGITAVGTESKSQHQNKKTARERLTAKLASGNLVEDKQTDQQWNWCEWRDEVTTPTGNQLNMSKTLKRGLDKAQPGC